MPFDTFDTPHAAKVSGICRKVVGKWFDGPVEEFSWPSASPDARKNLDRRAGHIDVIIIAPIELQIAPR